MERNSSTNFLALFRFSNIARILSYCNYLDQWKRIMTMLCKFSNKQWMRHEEAFVWFGWTFKRNIYIKRNAASDIQKMVSVRQLFNQMLLKRKDFKLYLEKICLRIKPDQELAMHLFEDDTNYLVLNFFEKNESGIFLTNIEWIAHKPMQRMITQNKISFLAMILEESIDLNLAVITRKSRTFNMKLILSPIIKLNRKCQSDLINLDSKFNNLYSINNWTWCVQSVVWEDDEVDNANRFWKSFKLRNTVSRAIYILKEAFDLADLDNWNPLHNLCLPHIEIKNENCISKGILKHNDSMLLVYLKPSQFLIKTRRGRYLVESASSNIVIVGEDDIKVWRKSNKMFIIKSQFILGEHYKVKFKYWTKI